MSRNFGGARNFSKQTPGPGSPKRRKTTTGKMVPKSKAHQPSIHGDSRVAGPRQKKPNTPMKKKSEKAVANKGKAYSRRGQVMATAPKVFRGPAVGNMGKY